LEGIDLMRGMDVMEIQGMKKNTNNNIKGKRTLCAE